MTVASWTEQELSAEYHRFVDHCHPVRAQCADAKKLWEDECAHAAKNKVDRWATLAKYETKYISGKPRPFGTEIMSVLRKHLAKLQGNRCCYCRRWLQNIAHARPIEHVLSRKDYPQFSLHYNNLALCCRDCNQLKSDDRWGTLPTHEMAYPNKVEDYFHPRIHRYDYHIRFSRVETNQMSIVIYHGLTDQGRQLCRDHLKTISQMDGLIHNNPRISKAITSLQVAGEMIDPAATGKLNEFVDALHAAMLRIAKKAM